MGHNLARQKDPGMPAATNTAVPRKQEPVVPVVTQKPTEDAEATIGKWLRRIDTTGFLDGYAKGIAAHFKREEEVRRAMVHKDANGKLNFDSQFYTLAGIKKAG